MKNSTNTFKAVVAILAITVFVSCKKEPIFEKLKKLDNSESKMQPKKPPTYTGGTGTSDSTITRGN